MTGGGHKLFFNSSIITVASDCVKLNIITMKLLNP